MDLSFTRDRKSTRLNSSHSSISYAVFCLKKKNIIGLRVDREEEFALVDFLSLREDDSGDLSFFFEGYGDHRDLHSFPTRRSSDLLARARGFQTRLRSTGEAPTAARVYVADT